MPDRLLQAEHDGFSRTLRLGSDESTQLTRAVSMEAADFELGARIGLASSWLWLEHGGEQAGSACWRR